MACASRTLSDQAVVRASHGLNSWSIKGATRPSVSRSIGTNRSQEPGGRHVRSRRSKQCTQLPPRVCGLTLPSSGPAFGRPLKSNVRRRQTHALAHIGRQLEIEHFHARAPSARRAPLGHRKALGARARNAKFNHKSSARAKARSSANVGQGHGAAASICGRRSASSRRQRSQWHHHGHVEPNQPDA